MERACSLFRAGVSELGAVERARELVEAEAERCNQKIVAVEASFRAMLADAEAARLGEEAARVWATALEADLDKARSDADGFKARLEEAQAGLKEARAEVARAKTEAAEAKTSELAEVRASAEADAAKAVEARVVSSQGATFRAVMVRLLFSDSFSETIVDLARLVVPLIAGAALNAAAADFPGLDVSRYAEPALGRDELNRQYAMAILRSLDASPVVKAISEATSLLSVEEVSGLGVDQDAGLDAAAAAARAEFARKGKQAVPGTAERGEVPEEPRQEKLELSEETGTGQVGSGLEV